MLEQLASGRERVLQPLPQVAEMPEALDWVNNALSLAPTVAGWQPGNDGRVRIWSAKGSTNRHVAELLGHGAAVGDVQFDPRDLMATHDRRQRWNRQDLAGASAHCPGRQR